ncbi:MAG: OmpA family protein [Flavobacteriales bacterium]|nr:OmpA family protein [Flavobacteriales bacterium]
MKKFVLFLLVFGLAAGCVPIKKFEELQANYDQSQEELARLKTENSELSMTLKEIEAERDKLAKAVKALEADTTSKGKQLRALKRSYQELNDSYELLIENNNSLIARNAEENRRLLEEMQLLEAKLQGKEDSLRMRAEEMDSISTALMAREAKVNELQRMLTEKDSAAEALRKSVADALLGFKGKGVNVEEKDGRIYVTLDNSLLFESGKWDVGSEGTQALDQLSAVLADNPDINILIEGHTDDDKYYGGQVIKDNWDLSVMRATSVVKILTKNKGVDPTRVTAAGRSEYLPVASNEEDAGKAKNRRIEIILIPDYQALLDLINE